MLSKKDFSIFLLNFVAGLLFLTVVFHYFLSLSVKSSLVAALILSSVLDSAYVLNKKVRPIRRRGDRVILMMLTLVCLIYGTLGIHHVLALPLLSSLLIATILTVLVDFAYVTYVKRRKPKEKKVYSI